MKPKITLLKGKHQDIVDANITSLKNAGYSHAHATHLSLKHSHKNHDKKAKSIAKKVTKKSDKLIVLGV